MLLPFTTKLFSTNICVKHKNYLLMRMSFTKPLKPNCLDIPRIHIIVAVDALRNMGVRQQLNCGSKTMKNPDIVSIKIFDFLCRKIKEFEV